MENLYNSSKVEWNTQKYSKTQVKNSKFKWKIQNSSKKTQKLKQKTQGFGKSTWSTCRKHVQKKAALYAESNKLKFINFKQTFTNTNFEIKKSYKFCYVVNWCNLDWTSCAIPLKPGREFSTYLVQSKLHFEEFYEFYQEFSINPQLSL